MPKSTSRHLQLQFTGTAANVCRLTHLIIDQYQRHANTQKVAAYLKQNQASFDEFAAWKNEPNFIPELQEAAKNPRRKKSMKMCQRIMYHVNVISQKIPFSSSARKGAMSKLMATCYRYCHQSFSRLHRTTFTESSISDFLSRKLATMDFQHLTMVSSMPSDKEQHILWIFPSTTRPYPQN